MLCMGNANSNYTHWPGAAFTSPPAPVRLESPIVSTWGFPNGGFPNVWPAPLAKRIAVIRATSMHEWVGRDIYGRVGSGVLRWMRTILLQQWRTWRSIPYGPSWLTMPRGNYGDGNYGNGMDAPLSRRVCWGTHPFGLSLTGGPSPFFLRTACDDVSLRAATWHRIPGIVRPGKARPFGEGSSYRI